jgi:superfamily II DNA/RNA helicase
MFYRSGRAARAGAEGSFIDCLQPEEVGGEWLISKKLGGVG